MSYELSFTEDFFYPVGEDLETYEPEYTTKPTNLYDAIAMLKEHYYEDFEELCKEADVDPAHSQVVWHLVEYARYKVNSCSNLSTPVQVWLDRAGWITVDVY